MKFISKLQIYDFLVSSEPKAFPGHPDYAKKVYAAIIDRGLIDETRLRDCDTKLLHDLSVQYAKKASFIWKKRPVYYDPTKFRICGLKSGGFLTHNILDLSQLPPECMPAKAKKRRNRRPGGGRKEKPFNEKGIRAKQKKAKVVKDSVDGDPEPIIMAANAVASKFDGDFAFVLHKLTNNPTLTKKVRKIIEKGGNLIQYRGIIPQYDLSFLYHF